MTASEKILQKALVGSDLSSDEWSKIQAGLRDRAFFSARVESMRFLYNARDMIAKNVSGELSESEIRRDLRNLLSTEGYTAPVVKDGTLQDLTSKKRLDLIIRTNAAQARGYIQFKEGMDPAVLAAFPAQELIRVQRRNIERDWHSRWQKCGGRFYGGRMIALKTDPIWYDKRFNRFETPYPPFDFNSGMGVRDIGRRECLRLGVISEDDPPQKPVERGFNDSLCASVPFKSDKDWDAAKNAFGDQIQIDKRSGEIKWRDELFAENFDKGGNFVLRLGEASGNLLGKLPNEINAADVAGKQLYINQDWLDNKRERGGDHRVHFEVMPDQPNDIPLEKRDVAMLSPLWHSPDRVFASKGRLVNEIDALDGSIFRAVIDVSNNPILKTFYRTRKPYKQPFHIG